jgi:hypothetical protein
MKRITNLSQDLDLTFSSWLRNTLVSIWKVASEHAHKITSGRFFRYNNIPLSLYVQIVNTGDLSLLRRSWFGAGKIQAWEQLCESAAQAINESQYNESLQDAKNYFRYSADYIYLSCLLTKLLYVVDHEAIKKLKVKGYKINLSSSEAYANSIYMAFHKLSNVVDKAK